MILPIIVGKLSAGAIGIGLAYWLSVPKALELEEKDREAGVIGVNEYKTKNEEENSNEIQVV